MSGGNNPINAKLPVKYSPETALAICEEIASGKTLVEVCQLPGMPSRNTIYKWLTVYPKFYDAFERAKEISAQSLEEEALTYARALAGPNDFTGVKVSAYNVAMTQLRWSAARRDPNRFGQKMNSTSVVPIQITTTLNLGQDGQPATDNASNIYTVEARVEVANEPPADEPPMIDVTPNGEHPTAEEPDEPRSFGLPDEETQQLYNPKPGRPKGTAKGVPGRRKSAAAVLTSVRKYEAAAAKKAAKQKEKE